MTRVGNYGNRRSPVRSNSRLVRQFFDMLDANGIYAKTAAAELFTSDKPLSRWRRGYTTPTVATLEHLVDRLGYEFVLVKKDGER